MKGPYVIKQEIFKDNPNILYTLHQIQSLAHLYYLKHVWLKITHTKMHFNKHKTV